MNESNLPLVHLARRPPDTASPPPMLILLHGYGSNEQDLFGLVPYLDDRLLIVSARAPYTLMPGMYGWFTLDITPRGIGVDPDEAEASRQQVAAFVEQAAAVYGADPARVILGGFSQGGMMAAAVALTRPELLAGAMVLSGMVPHELLPQIAPPEQLAGKPFLVQHGTYDPVLPVQLGRAGRDLLQTLPVALTYHEYPIAHEISLESLNDMRAWLADRLD
jgi:phospholipase/carboxylesterase